MWYNIEQITSVGKGEEISFYTKNSVAVCADGKELNI